MDYYAITKLVMNTCKSISNICYFALGASLSASFGGHRQMFELLFQRVRAGSQETLSKVFTPHPNPTDFDHRGQRRQI